MLWYALGMFGWIAFVFCIMRLMEMNHNADDYFDIE